MYFSMGMGNMPWGILASWLVISVLIMAISIASTVFFAMFVYHYGQSKNDTNAVLFTVLSVFFPIVGMIYVLVKEHEAPRPVFCTRCGQGMPAGLPTCPHCGMPAWMPPAPYVAVFREKRTKYLKRYAFCIVGEYGVMIVWLVVMILTTLSYIK